jgi:hypothetical protein
VELLMLPGISVYTAPATGVIVMTPSVAPGQLVLVLVAGVVPLAGPDITRMLLLPLQPFASVNTTVCTPAVIPVNVLEGCAMPPSIL